MAETSCRVETRQHDKSLFNILLLGRTGQGKSKTGNKLLNASADELITNICPDNMPAKPVTSIIISPLSKRPEPVHTRSNSFSGSNSVKYFEVAKSDDIHSCTVNCTYLKNEDETIGVLDTPGLGDSKEAKRANRSIDQINLKLIRKILIYQAKYNIAFNCVLYFVPVRGAPSKVDAFILDELRVFKRLIGKEIFRSMIMVLTRDELDEHTGELPQGYFERTSRVYRKAFDTIGYNDIEPPPIIYVGIKDDNRVVLEKVKSAFPNDQKPQPLEIKFRNDRCCKCSGRLIRSTSGLEEKFQLVENRKADESKEVVDLDRSWCHPMFVPRYTWTEKIFGTVKWFLSAILLIQLLSKTYSVDCVTLLNNEEVCIKCRQQPGSVPCAQVNKKFQEINVCHSTEL